jgi:hypothetical protein
MQLATSLNLAGRVTASGKKNQVAGVLRASLGGLTSFSARAGQCLRVSKAKGNAIPQDGSNTFIQRNDTGPTKAKIVLESQSRAANLSLSRRAAQLLHELRALGQARSAERMSLA